MILAAVLAVGWQIASAEISSAEFHGDLTYIARQLGANVGLGSPKTDDQVRQDVISSAAEHGIHLQPDEVQVQRVTDPPYARFNLAVRYKIRVNLLVSSFDLHFDQTIAR